MLTTTLQISRIITLAYIRNNAMTVTSESKKCMFQIIWVFNTSKVIENDAITLDHAST